MKPMPPPANSDPQHMTLILDVEMPISVHGFFKLLYADDADLPISDYRKLCGDWDPVLSLWQPEPGTGKLTRDFTYRAPLAGTDSSGWLLGLRLVDADRSCMQVFLTHSHPRARVYTRSNGTGGMMIGLLSPSRLAR